LTKQRAQRKSQVGKVRLSFSFKEDLEDPSLSPKERYNKVVKKIAIVERRVREIGQAAQRNGLNDLDVEDEIDRAVISTVKAKLVLLDSTLK
jgi:hypothetical protein